MPWSSLIDVVRGALFVLAHWCGGSFGAAIVVASFATRVALFPVTLGATRRRLARERDKVTTPDPRGALDALAQLPPALALNAAIRSAASGAGGFLWIRNLASPDRGLAAVAALVSAALAAAAVSTPAAKGAQQLVPLVVTGAITFLMLSHFSAGLALYSVANSAIGAAERGLAVRTLRRTAP